MKTIGNPEGVRVLACDYIGTKLAALIGLPTLDVAILEWPEELVIDLGKGCTTEPGPAFATRGVLGREWGGSPGDLLLLDNPEAISGLVVLDTWLRHPDRFKALHRGRPKRNEGNVYFSAEGARKGHFVLLAIDQGETICQGQELGKQLGINERTDEDIYGLFPEFVPHVTRESIREYALRLASIDPQVVREIVANVPSEWAQADVRQRIVELCVDRAVYVAERIETWLETECKWQTVLDIR